MDVWDVLLGLTGLVLAAIGLYGNWRPKYEVMVVIIDSDGVEQKVAGYRWTKRGAERLRAQVMEDERG